MRFSTAVFALDLVSTCYALFGQTLRIVPLGDSITVGAQSSTYDGYRRNLTNLLDGNQVNFIGYRTSGTGRDVNIQAHGGYFINDIQAFINDTFSSKPTVYLIHAGTNNIAAAGSSAFGHTPADCTAGAPDCQQAANALAQLVDTAALTGALVVVAQIVPGNSSSFGGNLYTRNVAFYNNLVQKIVRARDYPGTGYKIQLANMQRSGDGVTLDDISSDGIHPVDRGYAKMAQIWLDSINNASTYNLIPNILPSQGYPTEPCSSPFNGAYSNGQIVASRGVSNFFIGVNCTVATDGSNNCVCSDETSSSFVQPRIGSCAEMSLTFTTASRWADLNGDTRQDNVWISKTGSLNASLAVGSPTKIITVSQPMTLKATFRELGMVGPSNVFVKRYEVRLADMNGDARADYVTVAYNGGLTQYTGLASYRTLDTAISASWNSTGIPLTTGFGLSGVGVRLVDWDGDGRADYVWVSADGSSIQVWLNTPSSSSASGLSWTPQGTVGPAIPTGSKREFIVLADIDADGRADVIVVSQTDGSAIAYLNKPPGNGGTAPQWKSIGTIVYPDQSSSVGGGSFLAVVDFADPDADGAFDYVVTNGGTSQVMGLRNPCIPDAD